MELYERQTINKIIEFYGVKATKSLGQNFLIDKDIVDSIADGSLIGAGDLVIEIGPGLGVITAELAKHAKKVIAIEIDQHLIPVLTDTLSEYNNVEIVNADVLDVDFAKLIEGEEYENLRIIGNLPYYITTPIIMRILEEGVPATSMTFMMQREVADRITAKTSTKDYGPLAVSLQFYSNINVITEVSRSCFYPQPNVDSIVIRFDVKKEAGENVLDRDSFFKTVKAGFALRRKTLSNSLTTYPGIKKEQVLTALENASIDPIRRAETLTIDEFASLANEIYKLM